MRSAFHIVVIGARFPQSVFAVSKKKTIKKKKGREVGRLSAEKSVYSP